MILIETPKQKNKTTFLNFNLKKLKNTYETINLLMF